MSDSTFKTPRERDDFLIALAVIGFFLWLFLFSGLLGSKKSVKDVFGVNTEQADFDGDGVTDTEDLCPRLFGETKNGCPVGDADNDGISNEDDRCPQLFGDARNNGCPHDDADGDGVLDHVDECPGTYGTVALRGCPAAEAEVDTLRNRTAVVPLVAGKKGKLDKDKDGIVDSEDDCPEEQGVAENNGCPILDADNDGVQDDDDECPEAKGRLENNSCPDIDNDGIVDKDDDCPQVPGVASNDGCPELVLEEEDQRIIDEAIRNVEFEYAKATLTPKSKSILDRVAELMAKYPEAKLKIDGHTDNQSGSDLNLRLSRDRAASCKTYLVSKGISDARIETQGFGETNPVASNDTEAGRSENRRVEFDLNY